MGAYDQNTRCNLGLSIFNMTRESDMKLVSEN
jgi:hypothetical protein